MFNFFLKTKFILTITGQNLLNEEVGISTIDKQYVEFPSNIPAINLLQKNVKLIAGEVSKIKQCCWRSK